jgi:hypothetical protein
VWHTWNGRPRTSGRRCTPGPAAVRGVTIHLEGLEGMGRVALPRQLALSGCGQSDAERAGGYGVRGHSHRVRSGHGAGGTARGTGYRKRHACWMLAADFCAIVHGQDEGHGVGFVHRPGDCPCAWRPDHGAEYGGTEDNLRYHPVPGWSWGARRYHFCNHVVSKN